MTVHAREPSRRARGDLARRAAGLALLAASAAGCASLPPGAQASPRDPFERFNRGVFAFNDAVDRAVTRPVARAYETVLPEFARQYIGNFFGNVGDVITAANQLLQGKPVLAISDATRVVVNTVFGFAGLVDVASDLGLQKHREDFGQTLGLWGLPNGPYLVLPVFGPSTVRDGAGLTVDLLADPVRQFPAGSERNSAVGLRLVDARQRLLSAERVVEGAALDRYSFLRDAYLQRRRSQVYDGDPPPEEEEPYDEAGPADAPEAGEREAQAPGATGTPDASGPGLPGGSAAPAAPVAPVPIPPPFRLR